MNRIKEVMADEINKSPWLDNNTRLWAKQKLDHMIDLIGYPDWYNETELNNYYKNVRLIVWGKTLQNISSSFIHMI